ncbi:MAG: hypothetical protein WCJ02_17000 [bacterium]
MTSTERIAYRLILNNGTVEQIHRLLWDIKENEPTVPETLIADIIGALRTHGVGAIDKLAWRVHELIGKTKSMSLYQAAAELGYLSLDCMYTKAFLDGKTNLFVTQCFYTEEGEKLAIDELFRWITYLDQAVRQKYRKDLGDCAQSEEMSYDTKLENTQFFSSPLYPANRILDALSKIASPAGHEALASMEYIFRPRLNEYRMAEQKQALDNNGEAVTPVEQDDVLVIEEIELLSQQITYILDWPSTASLGRLLDRIAAIARGITSVD